MWRSEVALVRPSLQRVFARSAQEYLLPASSFTSIFFRNQTLSHRRWLAGGQGHTKHFDHSAQEEEAEDGEEDEEPWEPIKIVVPRERVKVTFSRSSGPGGQNVNKVNTKAELRFSLKHADWIPDRIKMHLREQRGKEITKDGEFIVTCSEHRLQQSNVNDAFKKLQSYIDVACEPPPKKRIPTKVPRHAIEKRLKEKKARSEVKQFRSGSNRDY